MKKVYSYIRISSDQQRHGRGVERQLELTRAFCDHHGYQLVESIKDYGKSAFHGEHLEAGLGRFLDLCKNGHVKKGSLLCVESIDRISRERTPKGLRLLLDILDYVDVHFLEDGQTYSSETLDTTQLILSLARLERSYSESKIKSERLTYSWKSKRENAVLYGIPASKRCPWWLTLNDDRKEFSLIPERVAVLQEMFRLSADGIGSGKITTILNERGTTGPNGGPVSKTTVQRALKNKAVLGYGVFERKGESALEVKDYYPSAISEELYYRNRRSVEARIDEPKVSRGRQGKEYSNILTRVAVCAECGGTMRCTSHKHKKLYRYLFCTNRNHSRGCLSKPVRMDWVEGQVITHLIKNDTTQEVVVDTTELITIEKLIEQEQGHLDGLLSIGSSNRAIIEAIRESEGKIVKLQENFDSLKKRNVRLSEFNPDDINFAYLPHLKNEWIESLRAVCEADIEEMTGNPDANPWLVDLLFVANHGSALTVESRYFFRQRLHQLIKRKYPNGIKVSRTAVVFSNEND